MSLNIDMKMIRSSKFSCWKSLEIFPLEFNCFSIDSHSTLVRGIPFKIFNLSCPFFIGGSQCLFSSTNTQNWICVDTNFCRRALDPLIIDQRWYRPWGWWIIQASHIQKFFGMFLYQLLSNVEDTPNILEPCVLEDFRILQEIWPMMDGGFHRRRHDHFPYQYIRLVASSADPLEYPSCIDDLSQESSDRSDITTNLRYLGHISI